MKINLEVDCTPHEAREFLGLPDVSKANDAYVEAMAKAIGGLGGGLSGGVANIEQLQEYAKTLAPMGQMGLKLFQQFIENGAAFGGGKKAG